MPKKPAPELKFISEKLTMLFDDTVAEPLPERWAELFHALNQRELREGKANDDRQGHKCKG